MTTPTLTRWEDDAACRPAAPVSPDWWWPDTNTRVEDDTASGRALHICLTHCPVLDRCRQAAEQSPPEHPVVVGGIRYVSSKETGRRGIVPAKRGPAPHSHGCPYCRRGAR